MGNKLFIQAEDPNSYPIAVRHLKMPFNCTAPDNADPKRVIHVMSYNLLADRLAYPHIFTHTTPARLSFQFRGPRILAEIRASDADILCLQEVDRVSDFYDGMLSALGYKLVHYGRPGLFRGEGVAIAFKIDKFKLLQTEQINMDDLGKIYPGGSTFRRANQALLCLFEMKEGGRQFVAGTCHLHFNPKLDFVKYAQALYLKERAVVFVNKHGKNLPLFIGGDYNSMPMSSVMSMLHSEDIEAPYDPIKYPS